jgi:hypothetical protein
MDICHVLFDIIGRAFPLGKIPGTTPGVFIGNRIIRNR